MRIDRGIHYDILSKKLDVRKMFTNMIVEAENVIVHRTKLVFEHFEVLVNALPLFSDDFLTRIETIPAPNLRKGDG